MGKKTVKTTEKQKPTSTQETVAEQAQLAVKRVRATARLTTRRSGTNHILELERIAKNNTIVGEDIPLTEKEEIWCRVYMRTKCNKESARAAYPEAKETSLHALSVQNMKNALCLKRLAQLWEDEKKKLNLDQEGVLLQMGAIATIDIRDFVDIDARTGAMTLKQDYDGRAVKSITPYRDNGVVKYEIQFWDKNKALENYGRFHKMLTDKVEAEMSTPTSQVFKIGEQTIEF